MEAVAKLLGCIGAGLAIFCLTIAVYGLGIGLGWATYSGVFVASVAIQNIALSFLLWVCTD
jgi:Na+-transporting NADH:ubiquinone oxidoreductase subunit NqrE